MIGKLFDRFVEWSLKRNAENINRKAKAKPKVSRVRRKASTKRK